MTFLQPAGTATMLLRNLLIAIVLFAPPAFAAERVVDATPLAIGQTFELPSAVLAETRRINIYRAAAWDTAPDARLPVLYMPDGGVGEDFLHVAGLLQVSVGNGTMRPFLLVGIENTQRRRDLTGPTENPDDRRIAPRVGGSAAFRTFLRDELMPDIARRYRTTDEKAIVGESLAGVFVVETFVLEPALFDTYIAFDPSLWWNGAALLPQAGHALARRRDLHATLYLANSRDDVDGLTAQLSRQLAAAALPGLVLHYAPMPEETHATIYHPVALRAFRTVFAPAGK